MNKTFLLGVGAQKSGTSWLYSYLHAHPNANFGFLKEYHVFDALYIDDDDIRKGWLQDRINKVVGQIPRRIRQQDLMILKFLGDTNAYFNYFNHLVSSNPECALTGDITPSYSGLPPKAFEKIKHHLSERGFRIKVVFLMRDPVERCISAVRHHLRDNQFSWNENDENMLLNEEFSTSAFALRTRYDLTIKNLEKVFSDNEIVTLFYEDFFNEKSVRGLCDFVGISYIKPNFDHEVNVSRTHHTIHNDLKKKVFDYYSETYGFITERFGDSYMRSLWSSICEFS